MGGKVFGKTPTNFKNRVGEKFGMLTVISKAPTIRKGNRWRTRWECKCDCGKIHIANAEALQQGLTKSCGCLKYTGIHTGKGENSHNWKGGRYTTNNGYIRVWTDASVYRFEHVLVMEKHLGRKLLPKETVHHKNGIRDDNRLENLELKVSNHGSGQSIDDLVEYWTDQLRKYAPDRLSEDYQPVEASINTNGEQYV